MGYPNTKEKEKSLATNDRKNKLKKNVGISKLLTDVIKKYQYDIAVASRYIKGGKIQGWSLKRKIMSKFATLIAKKGLGIDTKDPMSGFFGMRTELFKKLAKKRGSFVGEGFKVLFDAAKILQPDPGGKPTRCDSILFLPHPG